MPGGSSRPARSARSSPSRAMPIRAGCSARCRARRRSARCSCRSRARRRASPPSRPAAPSIRAAAFATDDLPERRAGARRDSRRAGWSPASITAQVAAAGVADPMSTTPGRADLRRGRHQAISAMRADARRPAARPAAARRACAQRRHLHAPSRRDARHRRGIRLRKVDPRALPGAAARLRRGQGAVRGRGHRRASRRRRGAPSTAASR